jgi:hypothetical protein
VEKLLGMLARKDDPQIGAERLEVPADLGRCLIGAGDGVAVLGLGHRKELRRMGQHRPADHA